MGRQMGAFYDAFFTMLRHAAAGKPPSLSEILRQLHDRTGKRYLSFGSKLLATVDD
jgi:hypothetical protein